MAPLHHHFEMCGWSEEKVVTRFRLVGVILAVLGLVCGGNVDGNCISHWGCP